MSPADPTPLPLLELLAEIVERFNLLALRAHLEACQRLRDDREPLDVAVLGQFKAGKSSLLNALVGEPLLPTGVIPVTSVVTRLSPGPRKRTHVTYLNGATEEVPPDTLDAYVSEKANPNNVKQVARVDVEVPGLAEWAGLRLVDTPGLGSTHDHNTQATRDWLPQVGVAIVVISADRPLAAEDRNLIAEVCRLAPRVSVVLTKVDLIAPHERAEVRSFVAEHLNTLESTARPTLFEFSTRTDTARWRAELRSKLLTPLASDLTATRTATLQHKARALSQACREYLQVALKAAERTGAARSELRRAVLAETLSESVLREELALTTDNLRRQSRTQFEACFLPRQDAIVTGLAAAMPAWHGHLAEQSRQFRHWINDHLAAALARTADAGFAVAKAVLTQTANRLERILHAFRHRLGQNLQDALGVNLSPVSWDLQVPAPTAPVVRIDNLFATPWELLWWMVPMRLVGGMFRRHGRRRLRWEVEKNLKRLVGDWTQATGIAMDQLQAQAAAIVRHEVATLTGLLDATPDQAAAIAEFLRQLERADAPS